MLNANRFLKVKNVKEQQFELEHRRRVLIQDWLATLMAKNQQISEH